MEKFSFDFYNPTSIKSYNLDKSIRYQLNILDTLDVFTRKHSENVANLTCRICEYLHATNDFTIYCTTGAYLHDIGKTYIPPSILQKQDALTPEEFEVMKTHTTIGYKMCMQDPELRKYADIVLDHHEKINGTGYPNGLQRKQIPVEAQIVAVADEFDAIVSKRQYKSHMEISDTLKIIVENATPINKKSKDITENSPKLNPLFVKQLLKVVIDDINYEIYATEEYLNSLQKELDRMNTIFEYETKANNSKNESKKQYYMNGINILLKDRESLDIAKELYSQYQSAYIDKKNTIEKLQKEIKIIKKMKV